MIIDNTGGEEIKKRNKLHNHKLFYDYTMYLINCLGYRERNREEASHFSAGYFKWLTDKIESRSGSGVLLIAV